MSASRIDRMAELRALSVIDVAPRLGLTVTPGRGLGPCPACGEEKRHPKRHDRRGALGVRPDGAGWRCFQCDESGDTVSMVALVLAGRVPDAGDAQGWRGVLDAAAERGLCSASDGRIVADRVVPRPVEAPRTLPPAGEVAALWASCKPLGLVPDIAQAWRERGGIDLDHLEDRDLARALPSGAAVPSWAWSRIGRWSAGPHRLVLPMFDAAGRLATLHARACIAPADMPKGLSPAKHTNIGTVFADPLGRRLLSGDTLGNGTPAADEVRRLGLLICEGAPDFLTWGTHWGDAAESAPAILGIISGTWTAALAGRVPDGTKITLATHSDDAGNKYATEIAATLSRCNVRRFSSTEAP